MRVLLLAVLVAFPIAPALAAGPEGGRASGVVHALLTYVPNRVLDVVDLVRLRVRVGPGVAIDARATEAADLFLGSYFSIYAGLPGPRGRRLPRLPVGIETRSGAEVSVADLSTGAGFGPDYSATEIGLGLQAFLVGVDVGVDPIEILDFAAGLVFVDLRGDDF